MYLASQCPHCPITRLGSIETSNRFCVYCNLGITIYRCTGQLTTWACCKYNSAKLFSTPPIMGSMWLHWCCPSKKVIVIFTDGLSWTFTISDTFLNLHCSISWPSNCWTSRAQWALSMPLHLVLCSVWLKQCSNAPYELTSGVLPWQLWYLWPQSNVLTSEWLGIHTQGSTILGSKH